MKQRFHRLTLFALALVATLFVLACGSSSSPSPTPTSPTPPPSSPTPPPPSGTADVTINITGMNGSQSYAPSPGTVKAGQTVAWHNADSVAHTATANSGAFNTGSIAPGATSAPVTMGSAGSFAYHCSFHPSMVGTLNVQ